MPVIDALITFSLLYFFYLQGLRVQALRFKPVKIQKNHIIVDKRSDSVETNDVKNLLLNATDPAEQKPC